MTPGVLADSFQGPFFLKNLRTPEQSGDRFLNRRMAGKNGESTGRIPSDRQALTKKIGKGIPERKASFFSK